MIETIECRKAPGIAALAQFAMLGLSVRHARELDERLEPERFSGGVNLSARLRNKKALRAYLDHSARTIYCGRHALAALRVQIAAYEPYIKGL